MNPIVPADSTPTGTGTLTQTELYLEGAPDFWFGGNVQLDSSTGFYWNLKANPGYPLYKMGCYTDFRLQDNIAMADIRCDTDGVRGSIEKRNFLSVTFNCLSMFPMSIFQKIVGRGGDGTVADPTYILDASQHAEFVGLGFIANSGAGNSVYFPCYFSKVYDTASGAFLSFTGHRCRFTDMTEIAFTYGQPYAFRVTLHMYADSTKPTGQRFCTVVRYDPTML